MVRSLLLVAMVILTSCRGPKAPHDATAVRDSLGLRITLTDARLVAAAGIFESVTDTVARVGSPDDQSGVETLFQVTAARFLGNGSFVVLQGGTELRFYDAHGRHSS